MSNHSKVNLSILNPLICSLSPYVHVPVMCFCSKDTFQKGEDSRTAKSMTCKNSINKLLLHNYLIINILSIFKATLRPFWSRAVSQPAPACLLRAGSKVGTTHGSRKEPTTIRHPTRTHVLIFPKLWSCITSCLNFHSRLEFCVIFCCNSVIHCVPASEQSIRRETSTSQRVSARLRLRRFQRLKQPNKNSLSVLT